MRVLPSLIVVGAVALIFGLAGAGIAAILARIVPGYYGIVFPHATRMGLDPTEAGIGLGFTQGLIAGIVVALAILALAAWRQHRGQVQASLQDMSDRLDDLELALRQLRQERRSGEESARRDEPGSST